MSTDELISIIKNECYISDLTDLDRTIMVNTALDQVISILNKQKLDEKYEDIPITKHSDGCEYCHDFFNEGENSILMSEPLYFMNNHKIGNLDVYMDSDRLVLSSDDILRKEVKIQYCPICGKKLEYNNRIKITNTDFDYDDPEFLINLELSVRSYNCLRRAGIFSINDFCKLDKDSLMHVKNLGRRSYAEIAFALKEHGVIISDILKTAMTYYPYFDNNTFYKGGLKWNGKC